MTPVTPDDLNESIKELVKAVDELSGRSIDELIGSVDTLAETVDRLVLGPTATVRDYTPGMEPPAPAEEGDDPDGLPAAVAKLAAAVDRLAGSSGGGGGGGGEAPGGSEGGGGVAGKVSGWAEGYLNRQATGAATRQVGGLFGAEAGGMAGQAVKGLMGTEMGAAAAGGPVGIAAAAAVAAATALKQFHDAVVDGAKAQHEQNVRLAEYSASMAQIQAEDEIRAVRRQQEIGEQTAATASLLSGRKNEYQDNAAEADKLGANLKNLVYTVGLEAINQALRPFVPLIEAANKYLEAFFGEPQAGDLAQWVKQAGEDVDKRKAAGDEWFNRRRQS